ncbi:MerR family transcriptional regulator [Streptomyces sp. 4N509B]|uniref:MerR family transcriptional regulator n=1 Tax=Streptomyces sp. 4N509B TaxID=3457413 RepID=UPI003FD20B7F
MAAHEQDRRADEAEDRAYRAAELAAAAGITERTLRFYRERGLLPPPRREGRVAWFDERHLARLRTIGALTARGHTLDGVAELLAAFAAGRDAGHTAELLGLAERQPWTEEEPVRLTPEELASYYEGEADAAASLATALEIGYLGLDGDAVVHVSRDLLEASSALGRAGIPLPALLAAGRELRDHAEALAAVFTELLRRHVVPELLGEETGERGGSLTEEEVARLAAAVERLLPLARRALHAEVSLALDRRLRSEVTGPGAGG